MAGMSKTNRSIDRGYADRVLAHHAIEDGRSPDFLYLQWAELIIEAQHSKIGQHCLMDEGGGCELCRSSNFGSFTDHLSEPLLESRDLVACLSSSNRDLGVTRELPKARDVPLERSCGGTDEHTAALAYIQHRPDVDRGHDPDGNFLPIGEHLSAGDHNCSRKRTMHCRVFPPCTISNPLCQHGFQTQSLHRRPG